MKSLVKVCLSLVVLVAFFSGCAKKPATIVGTVILSDNLTTRLKNTDVLFIIARSSQGGGMPLAVKKVPHPAFPFKYQLSAEDVMFQGTVFAGEMNVIARVSRTGDAMPAKGDFQGECSKNPVKVGEQQADIVVDQLL